MNERHYGLAIVDCLVLVICDINGNKMTYPYKGKG